MSAAPAKSRLGRTLLLLLAAAAAVAILAVYLTRPTARVVAVRRGNADDARPGSVTVEAEYSEPITTEVGGRLVKSNLEAGNHYQEGDFMAQIDTGDIDLEIQRAKNDLSTLVETHAVGSRTQLDLETAQDKLANDERLFRLGQIAQADIEGERRMVKGIEQSVALENVNFNTQRRADELAIRQLERQKSKMTITAPFDGVVSDVLARPGAILAGGAPLADLITTARTVEARISEEKFAGIAVGQSASVVFLGYNGKFFDAKVSKVLPTAEAATQRYVVYLDVSDISLDKLVPGMTGEVSIQVDRHPNALLVPRRALESNKVLVVNNGVVELRTVKLGYTSLTDDEVLAGLQQGDQVIAEDLDLFHPGERVRTLVLPD